MTHTQIKRRHHLIIIIIIYIQERHTRRNDDDDGTKGWMDGWAGPANFFRSARARADNRRQAPSTRRD